MHTKFSLLRKYPKVSFVIPTFNSSRTIRVCLESIINQNYSNLEIIIVDGYSEDNTVKIAREYPTKIYFSSQSYSQSRQLGIEKAHGEILGCFDSDIILPHRNWLVRAIEQFFSEEKIGSVWPVQVPRPRASLLQRAYLREQWGIIKRRVKKGMGVIGGSNGLFLKSCLEEVSGFKSIDIQTFDDFFLASKLSKLGYKVKIHWDPIIHDTNVSVQEFVRKQRERINFLKDSEFIEVTGCPFRELLYEYSAFSLILSIKGIFIDRDCSAILIPLFALIRSFLFLFT